MPRLARDVVARPSLLARLEASRSQAVTLLCAPAGYGKTTAVVAWLQAAAQQGEQPGAPVAWYSIDEGDDHLFTFASYLVAAIERALPAACPTVTATLYAVDLPAPEALAEMLLADLARLTQRLTLVLDDYHHIQASAIHQFVTAVLRRRPPMLHLVITARALPPLPLARLRAAGEVAELDVTHLAFSQDETNLFLERLAGQAVDAELVKSFHTQTEGWVAGLRLLLLAAPMSDRGVRPLPEYERRSQQPLFDFLIQEVLTKLSAATLDFLLDTSILSTLTPALCDAVVSHDNGRNGESATLLRQLVHDNLFTTESAEQDSWYRYHPQFQACLRQLLRQRRTDPAINQLYIRAAGWYGKHGYVTESMQAYLAAGLPERAADQLELALSSLYRQEQHLLLQHLMGLLPPTVVAARPALLMLQCWLAELRSQWAVMRTYADQAERLLHGSCERAGLTPVQTVQGEIYAARSYYLVANTSLAQQQAAAEQALALLPADHVQGRGFALINLARIYRWQGRLHETELLLENVLEERGLHPDALTLRLLNALTLHHVYTMKLDQAERTGQLYLALARESGLKLSQGFAHAVLGCVACLRNQQEQVDSHFDANAGDLQAVRAAVVMVQVYFYILLAGRRDPTRSQAIAATLDRLALLARQHGSAEMLRTVEALRVHFALQQGDKAAAKAWAQDRPMPPVLVGKPIESLIWARCKLAEGDPVALAQAQAGLEKLAAICNQHHDAAFHLEATALLALAVHAQGQTAQSLALLGPALPLAAAQRAPLAFLGHGAAMRGLLLTLAREPAWNDAAQDLLAMLDDVGDRVAPAEAPVQSTPAPSTPQYLALTRRERQIIEMLAQRLSNEEIAAALTVSPHTVRNHLANLYTKLDVTSRRAAVAEAQRLGLIPTNTKRSL